MESNTGINFIEITLTELNFKLNRDFKPPKDGIPVDISFKTKKSFSSDKKALYVVLSATLFQKTKNKPFVMKVSVEGTFTGKSYKELEKFSKIHAPAHLFPFVREIIGNTTMKANMPPLLLPPFNLTTMLGVKKN
ncbi:MAG: protein-export chaperone SecB [Nitrospiraceae bacterium]|nr:protein-export chaperone SecB [Nitrospiraceae bacterium]